jgi:cytochrome P450
MSDLEKYDLYSQAFKAQAYDTYAQLRAENPIRLHKGLQVPLWFVTGYDEARLVLADHKRFVKDARRAATPEELAQMQPMPPGFDLINNHMLNLDPPDHTRLRGLVSKAFTAGRIQALRPRVQQIANELLDAVQEQEQMDLLDDYAFPLPITVICELLGVPTADRHKFRAWSNAFVDITADETFMQLMTEFITYLGQMFAARRANPQDDLVSALIQAEEAGDRLNEAELYSMMVLLLVAGHETTVNLIANGMLALLQNPEQKALLQNDLSLLPQAIEEFLRYDGPVERATTRFAAEDVEIGGQLIRRGTPVTVVLAGAERDPRHFANPDTLDITRTDNKHIGFGYGIHYCLGAPLARMEGEIAIGTLLRRIPNLQLAVPVDALEYRLSPIIRGLVRLPVTWAKSVNSEQ